MSLRTIRVLSCLATAVGLCLAADAWAQEGFEELLLRTPSGANAIALINVEKTLGSPIGIQRNWRMKLGDAFESGAISLPPAATFYVEATQLDFETMTPIWDATLVQLRKQPKFDEAVRQHRGTRDEIGGHPAAAFANDTYVVQFNPKLVGAMQPANRQNVSRWVRGADRATEAPLSKYLQEAANYAEFRGTEMILALDLDDVISPDLAERGLKESKSVKGATQIKTLTTTLAGLRGIMLGITFREKIRGKFKVDFEGSTAALGDLAKPLFLAALKHHGAMIDGIDDWQGSLRDKQFFLEGELSPVGLRQLLTLVAGPTTPVEQEEPEEKPTESKSLEELKVDATWRYFNSVATLVSDIAQKNDAKTLAQYGVWLTQYARKIENMSTAGVDSEVSRFGLYAAKELRNASSAVRGIGIQSHAREMQVFNQTGYGYSDGYGFYYYDANGDGQRRAIRAQEKAKGMTSAIGVLGQLESDVAEMRRRLTETSPVKSSG